MVKKIKFEINFDKRWFYTFIIVGILAIIGVGVYAVSPNPGHSIEEIDFIDGSIQGSVIDFSGGIDEDVVFNGKVGIGAPISSTYELIVDGHLLSTRATISDTLSTGRITLGNINLFYESSSTEIVCDNYCGSNAVCLGAWAYYGQVTTCSSSNGRNCLCARG